MLKNIKNYIVNIVKNIDKPLLLVSLILFSLGLVMIFSSSNVTAFMKYSASPYRYFLKQLLYMILSFGISMFLITFPSKSYGFCSKVLILLLIPSLVFLLLYGSMKNQAMSWIDLGIMSIQPSEFAKIIIIMYLASFYNKNKLKLDNMLLVLSSLIVPGIIAFLIFVQPDLGTMIIFSSIVGVMFLLSSVSGKIKKNACTVFLLIIAILGLATLTSGNSIFKDRQLQRFDIKNPCSEEKFYSTGNQVCNGYIAINNGGFKGTGLGDSTQKYLYLAESHTDFIFPIIVEETGVIGAFILFFLYFLLIGRILKITKESYNDRGKLIGYGVATYILVHIFVNLGGVLGLIPMTGVPLPFMSYGGSYLMCLVFALMFVQRVNIENNLFYESKKKKK